MKKCGRSPTADLWPFHPTPTLQSLRSWQTSSRTLTGMAGAEKKKRQPRARFWTISLFREPDISKKIKSWFRLLKIEENIKSWFKLQMFSSKKCKLQRSRGGMRTHWIPALDFIEMSFRQRSFHSMPWCHTSRAFKVLFILACFFASMLVYNGSVLLIAGFRIWHHMISLLDWIPEDVCIFTNWALWQGKIWQFQRHDSITWLNWGNL